MTLAVVGGQPIGGLPPTPVAIAQGGTGETVAAAALAALGGLDNAAHAALNHAGIPGVGDLTTVAHASLNHAGIPGIDAAGYTMWFATNTIVNSEILRPCGAPSGLLLTNVGIRAPKAGTLTVAVFDGDTASVDFFISAGGSSFNTGFVSNGAVVNPNLAVAVGDVIAVSINSIGSGSRAAWSLLIE